MTAERELIAAALPGYDVGEELGRGAGGPVYAGRQVALDRPVAIKLLAPAFAADPELLARFRSEGRILARLSHPHIVPVYDLIEASGMCVLVMEALPGGTLWDRFRAGEVTPPVAVASAIATLVGLHHGHTRGVLHRDIKPANLMYDAGGVLKVADFGIAKLTRTSRAAHLTRSGEVLGTPVYMSPEQARGATLTPASDLYSVAVVLYEMLADGELPHPEDGPPLELLRRRIADDPRPLTDAAPGVPAPVAEAVMRALARNPADRWADAEDAAVALARAANRVWGPGWLARSGVPVLAAPARLAAELASAPPAAPGPGGIPPGLLDDRYRAGAGGGRRVLVVVAADDPGATAAAERLLHEADGDQLVRREGMAAWALPGIGRAARALVTLVADHPGVRAAVHAPASVIDTGASPAAVVLGLVEAARPGEVVASAAARELLFDAGGFRFGPERWVHAPDGSRTEVNPVEGA